MPVLKVAFDCLLDRHLLGQKPCAGQGWVFVGKVDGGAASGDRLAAIDSTSLLAGSLEDTARSEAELAH
jgi:hypothetical protein